MPTTLDVDRARGRKTKTSIQVMLYAVGILSVAAFGFAFYKKRRRQAQPGSLSSIARRDFKVHGEDQVFAGTHVPVENLVSYLKGG